VLETQVNATIVFRSPVLAKYRLTYQAWPRDLKIRRNMTTTAWVDSYLAIAANNILVSTLHNFLIFSRLPFFCV
jgi:hypothetical protein